MTNTITTQTTSNASGRPQVIAKGRGKQRTINTDLSKSSDWNHGTAAGTLALVLGLSADLDWTHEVVSDGGGVHRFKA